MFELKPISKEAIPRSLARAERYRLLNEPQEAESICRDVLRADPENQDALVMLLLALTDQFGKGPAVGLDHAREVLSKLKDEYGRAYYGGVISERWAKSQLRTGALGHVVHDWFREAMSLYEQAEALSPAGNEDAVLRWNACARVIERDGRLRPMVEAATFDAGGDSPPLR